MRETASQVSLLLKVLAHPERLMIACLLVGQELSVGAIEKMLGIGQPGLSRHLTSLRAARVVSFRREGSSVFYHLADEKAGDVIAALHTIYCEPRADDGAF